MSIDPTAIVSPESRIGPGAHIGPHVIIEPGVVVGEECRVEARVVLKRGLRLGRGVKVFEGAVLGGEPQDLKYRPVESFAEVGDASVIREYATVHRSARAGGVTRIGQRCFLMAYGHVAHDCDIGDEAIIASYVALAGHIRVGAKAFISGGVVVHQFTRIGELAMVGGGSKINLDVPPFFTVDGVPGRAVGLNVVGLRRAGIGDEDLRALKKAYRILYRSKLRREEALRSIELLQNDAAQRLVEFIRASERGICADRRNSRRLS
ncbi:MAG: acyl-ACP--UDP-N-acetylglucosamine O-acyltransferase [Vicinamibacteria bacterium]